MKLLFIKKLNVRFISLVDNPANGKGIIFKSNDTFLKTIEIAKADDEKQIVYGIVYSPGEPDLQGMFTDSSVIEDAAYNFLKEGITGNVDNQHNLIPGAGFVCESWITKAGDPVFPSEPEGSWAVGIRITDEEIWKNVKNGQLRGLSLYGTAVLEESFPDDKFRAFMKKVRKIFKSEENEEETILPPVIDALFESVNSINLEIAAIKDRLKKSASKNESLTNLEEEVKKISERLKRIENFSLGSTQPEVLRKTKTKNIWY